MGLLNLDDALREGMRHHQAGRLGDAERIYREILSNNPNHAAAWHLLGTLAHQAGRSDVGVQMIEKSIALGLRSVEVYNNLGECYRSLRQFPQAIQAYQTGLQLNANHAETLSNLGLVLNTMGRHAESLPLLERAVQLAPGLANAHYNYGVSLLNHQRMDEAIAQWEETLKLQPDHLPAMNDLGQLLQSRKQFDEAVTVLSRLVEKYPNFAEGQANFGVALASAGRFEEGIAAAKKATELEPLQPGAFNALGVAYSQARRFEEAITSTEKAIELNPKFYPAIATLGRIYEFMEQYDKAEHWYRRAVDIEPRNIEISHLLFHVLYMQMKPAEALSVSDRSLAYDPADLQSRFNRATALLALGRYEEGFKEYECRWQFVRLRNPLDDLGKPVWNGDDPKGLTILVHDEQGFGDIIQCARYVPLISNLGARVVVMVRPALRPLFESMQGVSKVVSVDDKPPEFDRYIQIPSLPMIFRTTSSTIPADVPYISIDTKRVERWKPIIGTHAQGYRVGLVWGGKADPDFNRSCSIDQLASLADVPHVSWYSLQTDNHREELGNAPSRMNILDLGKDIKDFGDTAAIISQVDLMISIDTAAAHLAGALGRKTWTMLKYAPDWRWFLGEHTSPWYPTMKLFRQSTRNDWTEVVERLKRELLNLVHSR